MRKNINLGITADNTKAISAIDAVVNAQSKLEQNTKAMSAELKRAKQGISDVRALDSLKTSLGFTQGELDKTKKAISALQEKQRQHIRLTEAETVSLQQSAVTLSRLNEKKQQGITLSEAEEKRLIRAQSNYDKLNAKQNSHYQLTKKEQDELTKLSGKMSTLENKHRAQTRSLGNLSDNLKRAGFNTKELSIAQEVANRRAEKAAQLLERENRLMARSNALQARKKEALASLPSGRVVGAGIAAGSLLAGRQAVNNEANFVDVAKTLDFAGGNRGQEAEAMRNQLNRLAVEMAGVNEADVMRIAAGGATGGIAKEDLLAYTKDTIMTATAWDMDAESAAENGMALRNSLGYKSGEEGRQQFLAMSNMINDVANKNGGVKARDLLGVMSRTGALMTNSGFSEQGALGLSGALLSKGASEEQAATATKNIASRLTAGFSATDAQQQIYGMIGTDAQSVAEGMQADAMGTLLEVLDGINSLDATDQAAAIKELFGDEAAAHVQKLIKDTTKLKKIQADAQKASMSSVEDEYNGIAATRKAGFEQAGQAFNHLGIAIGDKLLPAIDPLLTVVADGAMAAAEFVNQGGIAVDILLGLGAAAVAGVAAYKAYQGFKLVRNLAGIAKESIALSNASKATDRHAKALERQAKASDRAARATSRGGVSGDSLRGGGGSRRRRRRGRAGLIAGTLGLGAGLFSSSAFASGGANFAADTVGAVGDIADGLPLAKAAKMAKFVRPLALGIDAVSLGSSLLNGDTKGAVETGGGMLGGIGGAALGATLGTFILPGIGTAIGGALGGLAGDSGGEWLASKVMDWFSSDELPDKSKEIQTAQLKTAQAKQLPALTFSPQIQISDVSDPKQAASMAMEQMQDLFSQFLKENGLDAGELTQDLNHSFMG